MTRRPHVDGWVSAPCPCTTCRLDRIAQRAARLALVFAVVYFGGHVLAWALTR